MSSSSYRSGVPSQRRTHAMPTSNSVMYGGRPRSLGLYNNNNASLSSMLSGTSYLGHASPSYLSGSPSSYLSSSPKGISSYLSSSPKSSAYYSGYSAGSPKSSSLLLPSAYSPSSSLSLSTYGGTTSGYGGLTISGLSPHRIVTGRSAARSSSFNLRNSKASTPSSTLSSRSGSWASLAPSSCSGSEGYASGGDWPSQSSRLSNSPSGDSRAVTPAARGSKDVSNENGEIDYKKLYEVTLAENERLKDLYETTLAGNERLKEQLKKTESDLQDAKSQLEKLPAGSTKNSLSEMEKRERRAMERKLSEMEEELKQLQKLKAENERLKAENRALTRVVSKLTNSANATK